jgi:hypothetical protein
MTTSRMVQTKNALDKVRKGIFIMCKSVDLPLLPWKTDIWRVGLRQR